MCVCAMHVQWRWDGRETQCTTTFGIIAAILPMGPSAVTATPCYGGRAFRRGPWCRGRLSIYLLANILHGRLHEMEVELVCYIKKN